jgi:hypothetical protein
MSAWTEIYSSFPMSIDKAMRLSRACKLAAKQARSGEFDEVRDELCAWMESVGMATAGDHEIVDGREIGFIEREHVPDGSIDPEWGKRKENDNE